MYLTTSARGLYHNLKDWRFEYCGDFKLMEQDKTKALEAFQRLADDNLYKRLLNWKFDLYGGFRITKEDYANALSAFKQLGDEEYKTKTIQVAV